MYRTTANDKQSVRGKNGNWETARSTERKVKGIVCLWRLVSIKNFKTSDACLSPSPNGRQLPVCRAFSLRMLQCYLRSAAHVSPTVLLLLRLLLLLFSPRLSRVIVLKLSKYKRPSMMKLGFLEDLAPSMYSLFYILFWLVWSTVVEQTTFNQIIYYDWALHLTNKKYLIQNWYSVCVLI